jgi:hypothetical protein
VALLLTVTGNTSQAREALNRLGADADLAVVRALRRTGAQCLTATVRGLARDLNLPQRFIRERLQVTQPTFRAPIYAITVKGRRLPLSAFGARQTRRGVTYRLPGGRGLIERGFLAHVRSARQIELGVAGHQGVFRRRAGTGRSGLVPRLPIDERFGPSLPQSFVRSRTDQAAAEVARDSFPPNLDHEIAFLASQGTT